MIRVGTSAPPIAKKAESNNLHIGRNLDPPIVRKELARQIDADSLVLARRDANGIDDGLPLSALITNL